MPYQIPTAGIEDSAVNAAKIATDAVGTTEIISDGVRTADIQNSAVTTDKLNDASVTLAKCETSLTNALVPVGGIIMYFGTESNIPTNWKLCDGQNGTPDLRNKFVIAADDYNTTPNPDRWETSVTGSATQSGGSKDAIVVDHQHTTTVTDDGHTHGISQTDHNHSYSTNQGTGGGVGGGGADTGSTGKSTGGASANITINDATTGITVDVAAAGSSGTNANLPPYFALAYIMRAS